MNDKQPNGSYVALTLKKFIEKSGSEESEIVEIIRINEI